MPEFPKSEPQIIALADRMISGYSLHVADFPNVNRRNLIFARGTYMAARKSAKDVRSRLRIETKNRNEKLLDLKNIMKQSLQKAQVDVSANPEKLKLIGWGLKDAFQPAQIPGQPIELAIVDKQNGTLKLSWKKPINGGTIYNYIIERRCHDANQSGNWTIAVISYNCQANLSNQPKGIYLEYRVRASNLAGQSLPSNTATITL
jgi:hypothetical protein